MRLTITFIDFMITLVILFALQFTLSRTDSEPAQKGWLSLSVPDENALLFGFAQSRFRVNIPGRFPGRLPADINYPYESNKLLEADDLKGCVDSAGVPIDMKDATPLQMSERDRLTTFQVSNPGQIFSADYGRARWLIGIDANLEPAAPPSALLVPWVPSGKPPSKDELIHFQNSGSQTNVHFALIERDGRILMREYEEDDEKGAMRFVKDRPLDEVSELALQPVSCPANKGFQLVRVELVA